MWIMYNLRKTKSIRLQWDQLKFINRSRWPKPKIIPKLEWVDLISELESNKQQLQSVWHPEELLNRGGKEIRISMNHFWV